MTVTLYNEQSTGHHTLSQVSVLEMVPCKQVRLLHNDSKETPKHASVVQVVGVDQVAARRGDEDAPKHFCKPCLQIKPVAFLCSLIKLRSCSTSVCKNLTACNAAARRLGQNELGHCDSLGFGVLCSNAVQVDEYDAMESVQEKGKPGT